MSTDTMERDPVEELAAEFVERWRQGDPPSVEEYAGRYPELASQILELFPTIAAIEDFKRAQAGSSRDGCKLESLGDYRLIREVGRGGMGIVYEAEQESLARRVAVKVLPSHTMLNENKLRRFQREARTAARLHHTNIVPVFGVGEQEGLHYYVMQLIRGTGLDAVVSVLRSEDRAAEPSPPFEATQSARALCAGRFLPSGGVDSAAMPNGRTTEVFQASPASPSDAPAHSAPRPVNDGTVGMPAKPPPAERLPRAYWKSVARLARQVAGALDYAHGQNVLHRDIKPANLLLDADGNVWIADFGLAKALEQDDVTSPGDVVGTLQYMAPEQFRGHYDARSDICSLGLTLYELLTLTPAFQDPNRLALIRKITDQEPARPRSINPAIPLDLETIVLKAIARDPARRYQSASELADDLERFNDDRPIRARRVGYLERLGRWCRRNPAVAGLSGLALFLGLVVAMLLLVVAIVATAGYLRTQDALKRETHQYQRAEATAGLALEVLDQVFDQLAPERLTDASELTFADGGDEAVEVALQPTLLPETAALLEKMLGFYDRLAAQETADGMLRHKIARATRRVGDIHFRLGQLDQSHEAYRRTVALYQQLLQQSPDDVALSAELAGAHNATGLAYWKGGRFDRAKESHLVAVTVLTHGGAENGVAPRIRYELARTCYYLGKGSFDKTAPMKGGPPGPWFHPESDQYLNRSIQILDGLAAEYPAAAAYRHLLALGYRARSTRVTGPFAKNDGKDRKEAIRLLGQLVKELPNVPDYRFDLSETLAATPPVFQFRKDTERELDEALRLANDLVAEHPIVADYQISKAQLHVKRANLQRERKELEKAEGEYRQAVRIDDTLVQRFPKVTFHQLARAKVQEDLGMTLMELRKWKECRIVLETAVGQVEKLLEKETHLQFLNFYLANNYDRLARTLRTLGEFDLATQADQQAKKHRIRR